MVIFNRISASFDILLSRQLSIRQIYRVFRYLFLTKILRRNIIRSFEIIHTLKCNCSCSFCSNEKLSEQTSFMEMECVIKTIDKFYDHGSVAVIFLGGESLMDKNIFDYMKYVKKIGMIPTLQTNGSLLTEKIINELINAGIYSVTITIHDTIAENHDGIVNKKGAFSTAINGAGILKKHGVRVNLKTVFSGKSFETGAFDRILSYAKDNNLGLNLNPIMPVGRSVSVSSMLNDNLVNKYLDLEKNETIISSHTKNEFDNQCPAGNYYLCISSDGEIMPCYFLPVSLGNIKDTDIDTAVKRSNDLGIFKKNCKRCVIAIDRTFYDRIIKELYSGIYQLPVRVYENQSLIKIFKEYCKND